MSSPLQLNSMVLYCVPRLRLMGQKFSVREKMDISGLQVSPFLRNPPTEREPHRDDAAWVLAVTEVVSKHHLALASSTGWPECPSLPDTPVKLLPACSRMTSGGYRKPGWG